jgi:membrane protein DedA with SNARE-associated domain
MPWHTFLLWNALGGLAWTSLYGFGAYLLGDAARRISGPAAIVLGVIGGAALLASFFFIKRNENRLLENARADMKIESARKKLPADALNR